MVTGLSSKPSQTRLTTQLTEGQQTGIAQRMGLIQHLPQGVYDPGRHGSEKKIRKWVICMIDFVGTDSISTDCVDGWSLRSSRALLAWRQVMAHCLRPTRLTEPGTLVRLQVNHHFWWFGFDLCH
ncbi:unnamed protein product [Gulo gulo]|uniref:Uncharacterized protein n=1 Tax=Gulo gulo TaxID=48420 RepID=A0A9X9LLC3_GULGU|nr:unnamed protein product [Gulo gulo]